MHTHMSVCVLTHLYTHMSIRTNNPRHAHSLLWCVDIHKYVYIYTSDTIDPFDPEMCLCIYVYPRIPAAALVANEIPQDGCSTSLAAIAAHCCGGL